MVFGIFQFRFSLLFTQNDTIFTSRYVLAKNQLGSLNMLFSKEIGSEESDLDKKLQGSR